jgi:hypothetical protein
LKRSVAHETSVHAQAVVLPKTAKEIKINEKKRIAQYSHARYVDAACRCPRNSGPSLLEDFAFDVENSGCRGGFWGQHLLSISKHY